VAVGDRSSVPRRGELWYAYTPGRDDPHQPRPVLVVSENRRNTALDHAIVVPIFSRGNPGPTRVPLRRGVGGLPHDSILFCEEISTLEHRSLEEGPLGEPVPETVLQQVVVAVRRAIGDVV
jgi:mRNA-degrading endonuclease toxin of MazEF toxin-antitoxin module